jgi:hypothetical protein
VVTSDTSAVSELSTVVQKTAASGETKRLILTVPFTLLVRVTFTVALFRS